LKCEAVVEVCIFDHNFNSDLYCITDIFAVINELIVNCQTNPLHCFWRRCFMFRTTLRWW